ncbi:ferritin-like domain-containing protein [Phreatobacter sp.]|uniref:ferritin-like domain-containing protein n=1 Tax=Phreatobacter sp. TaxID=1966341 RepID=UPI0025D72039|nr:ferritin-like domain-containing protein [Phreatobacter sp.]
MPRTEDRLDQWLRDAHAMEQQAVKMLDGMADRIQNYPDLKARITRHAEETRLQAAAIADCLKRRGTDVSTLKDMAGKVMGLGQAFSGLVVGDEIIKGSMAGYTFEHMEIAAYRVLVATAERAGDIETRDACQAILKEEEEMAAWLAEHLAPTTLRYLEREASGQTAKH